MNEKEPRGNAYVTGHEDLYVSGSVAVGDFLFADAIVGTSTIDIDSENAFVVQPYGDPDNWVLNVDTINREVNIRDTLTINSTATQGQVEFNIIGENDLAIEQPDAVGGADAINTSNDLYVQGDIGVGGKLYADAIIGAYTVDVDSHEAINVRDNGGGETVLNVDTIDNEVNITGNLTVSDTITIANEDGNRYGFNIIGENDLASTQPDAVTTVTQEDDLYMSGDLAIGGTLYADAVIGSYTIDDDDTDALVVRHNNAGPNVLVVDTINDEVRINDTLIISNSDTPRGAVEYNIIGDNTLAVDAMDAATDHYEFSVDVISCDLHCRM